LHSLFELLTLKKTFCVFIDFEKKTFDTVWREGLWCKLLMNHINGKMHNVIVNMYHNLKSRIMYNNEYVEFFKCGNGVRQMEIISPFLFSLILKDLETFLEKNNITGLKTLSDDVEQELGYYIKLFVIMYADDTILLADSTSILQNLLNLFQEYCLKWKLEVNIDQIKVINFSKGRLPTNILSMWIRN